MDTSQDTHEDEPDRSGPGTPTSPGAPWPADPLLSAVQEITDRSYTDTSAGGEVSVVVGGDQRLRRVDITRTDLPPGLLGARITEAVGRALATARTETVQAMEELPGLGPQLRQMSGGTGV